MVTRRILCVAVVALFLSAAIVQQAEAGKWKKLVAAKVLAQILKPRFVPIPIPLPFKIKINKGDKVVPYPVHSNDMHYGGGGGGYGGGMMGGGYGGGMMGGMGYD